MIVICTELSYINSLTALHFAALVAFGIAGEQRGAGVSNPCCSPPSSGRDRVSGASSSVAGEARAALGSTTAGDAACGGEPSQRVTESPVHPGSWQRQLVGPRVALWCRQCLAALWGCGCTHCSWGLVSLPKGEICVGCFTCPGLSLICCGSKSQGCS